MKTLALSLILSAAVAGAAFANPVDATKDAGRGIGHHVADAGRATGHAAMNVGRAGGHAVAATGRDIGHGVHHIVRPRHHHHHYDHH